MLMEHMFQDYISWILKEKSGKIYGMLELIILIINSTSLKLVQVSDIKDFFYFYIKIIFLCDGTLLLLQFSVFLRFIKTNVKSQQNKKRILRKCPTFQFK